MDSELVDAFERVDFLKRRAADKSRTIKLETGKQKPQSYFFFSQHGEEQSQTKLPFISFIATVSPLSLYLRPQKKSFWCLFEKLPQK